jgi:hypothetical protein
MLHSRFTPRFTLAVLLTLAVGAAFSPRAFAQDSASAAAAAELARLLDAGKLDSIAASDPDDPTSWVAALYFKDSQLLLVSAQYSAPSLLTEKMRVKDYRDIYLALFSSPIAGTKVFVMDSNANGLSARPSNGQAPDMWEQKDTTVMFDGEWRKAKMSEDDYRKAYADADSLYAKLLRLLATQAKGPSGT